MKTARVVGIVGACVVFAACSDLSDRIDGDTGGSGAGGDTSGSGTGGHEDGPGGSEATGGSTLGEAGSESGGMGGTGGAMPPTCEENCQEDGQICDVDTLTCICPPETPFRCPNDDAHCTNVMDDDGYCGDCETACPATSVCNDGACSALPEAIYLTDYHGYISALLLSGDTLYWSEAGAVLSMAVTGGPVTPVTQDDEITSVSELVIDGANLYAIEHHVDVTPPRLYRIPLTGGAPERIVTEETGIADVAVQAGVLYYTVGNQVKSVPADATDATGTIVASAAASEYLFGVAVDGSLLFWSAGGASLQPPESHNVEGDLISGGDRRTLGATQASYYGQRNLTTDGTRVYWGSGATLQRRVYDASTPQETIASAHGPQITAFAVNATTAYFASSDPANSIRPGDRLEKATFGAKPRAIARQQGVIYSLVVGESGVYWGSGNKIMRADL